LTFGITRIVEKRKFLIIDRDFEAIGKCSSLKWLEIYKSPSPEFYEWRNVPLDYLKLMRGNFPELGNIGQLKPLDRFMVAGCRKFERFTGENSSVRWLEVYSCRHFDTRSLNTLQGLEHLTIDDCASEIVLSDLPEHPTICTLGLSSCKVHADVDDIKKIMPMLEKISVPEITKDFTSS